MKIKLLLTLKHQLLSFVKFNLFNVMLGNLKSIRIRQIKNRKEKMQPFLIYTASLLIAYVLKEISEVQEQY